MLAHSLLTETIDTLLGGGADFAEIFVERRRGQGFEWNQTEIKSVTSGITYGAGLRLLYGEEVLYVHTNDLNRDALLKFAEDAANIKISPNASANRNAAEALVLQSLATNNHFNEANAFWKIPHEKRVGYCQIVDKAARAHRSSITNTRVGMSEAKLEVQIANSEGVLAEDTRFYSKAHVSIFAEANGNKEIGSKGDGVATTSEYFDTIDFKSLAEDRAEAADNLTSAPYAPSGEMSVVMAKGQGTLIHEACGHSLETSSVAEGDSVFAGKLGQKIAHECVSLVDDGTIKNTWGSINVDDEGTPAQRTTLIKDGKLVSYLTDRIGARKIDHPMTGSGRRESYKFAPTSRMRSTFIDKGEHKFDDMIASVEKGIYVKQVGGGSVSPATGEYQFSAIESYLIENGKIGNLVKGATLIGRGESTLENITMVSDDLELHGGGQCGSRSGWVPVDTGQPDVLISKLLIGGRA